MINNMQVEVREWITTMLPVRNPAKTCIKLVTESAELLESFINNNPKDIEMEIADVMILLLDIADQTGVDICEAFKKKMEINRNRVWRINDGSLRHD